jgi:glycosyltransferase involved in cell wall biosynthesis
MLGQTYRHFEVVVCDDSSSDGSCALIQGHVARPRNPPSPRGERRGNSALERLSEPLAPVVDRQARDSLLFCFQYRTNLALVVNDLQPLGPLHVSRLSLTVLAYRLTVHSR